MATSSGFWAAEPGRWLGSTKNIAGSALAVGAIAAQVALGLGPFWPFVVLASYAVGALVAPRDQVDLRLELGSGVGASAADLTAQLKVLRRAMKGEARRLPEDATAILARILDALDEVVGRWADLAGATDQRHVVERMVLDYLPTSLQAFLNLPRTFALNGRVEGKRSAHEELVEQLTILERESDRIRTAVYTKDLDKLGDQSRFLRDKFTKSALDLDQ